ncbi:MAG: ABC transporter substrate-binding protein [Candidatus Rokubacteria bacterium]|nr:ABC transporter substrate-binding protein [Candidatus Rokubacteria bacterium]
MRIIRAALAAALALGLFTVTLAAEAQPAGKVVRIGLLDYGAFDPRWNAFRERLRELGYVEGQNVIFEPRWGEGQVSRLRSLAAELVAAKVDILVTAGSEAALAAKQATHSIPIVTATGGDPVELGLVAGLARPGGNITGVISLISQLTGKRLDLLKQLLPRASRVAILRHPDNHASALSLRDAENAAKSLGVVVQGVGVRGPRDFDAAFLAMKRARIDAIIFGENTRFIADRRRIADLAVMHRLPMIVAAKEYAEAGGLISYGTDYPDLFRRAATYVDKILKGAKPADLPIEQPTKFELVINLKTAKALGLTIPPSLLQRADEVIQ